MSAGYAEQGELMLVLARKETETWLQAAMRMARPYGLSEEVHDEYFNCLLKKGYTESHAAYCACEYWDVLEYEPNEPETNEGESNGS